MNPGPWGMAQTGIPFGEVAAVRDWLGLEAEVGRPKREHPKRPVEGFACQRSEVSGRRLWGWAAEAFGTPKAFFREYIVINYCPLVFMGETGKTSHPISSRSLNENHSRRSATLCCGPGWTRFVRSDWLELVDLPPNAFRLCFLKRKRKSGRFFIQAPQAPWRIVAGPQRSMSS